MAPVPDFSHHRAARHWAWNRGVESVYEKGSEEIENYFFIAFLSCSQKVVNGGVSGGCLVNNVSFLKGRSRISCLSCGKV